LIMRMKGHNTIVPCQSVKFEGSANLAQKHIMCP
jgi:hypothetical protein